MDELENLFEYYVQNQNEIVAKYDGKYVVIAGNEVVGSFDTSTEALDFAKSKFEPGKFMIQLVGPGKENYTQVFHSRVSF